MGRYIPKSQRPYIGITDFTDNKQVRTMLKVFRENRSKNSLRRLHVGVMMSRKTLLGYETKWAKAFPPKETIGNIFYPVEQINSLRAPNRVNDVMFVLHYADYGADNFLFTNLSRALEYAGPCVDAIQLDMIWPDPDALDSLRCSLRGPLEIILQIGANAIEEANNNPDEVVERLAPYMKRSCITHVLLDKSMGKGLGMDAQGLLPYIRAIRKAYPELGLAVAGGLGPETMHLVEPIVQEFPDISIDAQGRLRPSGDALDPIDWDMAGEYLAKALKMFS